MLSDGGRSITGCHLRRILMPGVDCNLSQLDHPLRQKVLTGAVHTHTQTGAH